MITSSPLSSISSSYLLYIVGGGGGEGEGRGPAEGLRVGEASGSDSEVVVVVVVVVLVVTVRVFGKVYMASLACIHLNEITYL